MLRGSSPGMDTLGLKFAAVGSNITPDTLLKSLSVFSMLHILLPALWSKLHRLAAAQGWNRLSAGSGKKHAWSFILNADKAACAASLLNTV